MKKPKWQTEKEWALRRSKRKGSLPEEVEKLFLGDAGACIQYSQNTQKRLPKFLEDSIYEIFKEKNGRSSSNWLMKYANQIGRLPKKMEEIFISDLKENMSSRYDWGCAYALKYSRICENKINEELEQCFWKIENVAFEYSIQSKKRIPEKYEADRLKELDDDDFITYCKQFFKGRAPENIEKILLDNFDFAYAYAKNIMYGQLPEEIHTSIIMRSFGKEDEYEGRFSISDYIKFIKSTHIAMIHLLANFDKNDTVEDVIRKIGNIE